MEQNPACGVCPVCGRTNPENANYCMHCGADMKGGVKAEPKKERSRFLSLAFFRNCALLLISILLVVFAFLPLVKYPYIADPAYKGITIRFNMIDSVVFFFDSMHRETEEELKDSALAEKLVDLQAQIQSESALNNGAITPHLKKLIQETVKTMARIGLRSEETSVSIAGLVATVCAILYMMICAALLTLSTLNLILFLLGSPAPYSHALRLLCLIPAACLTFYAAFFAQVGTNAGNASLCVGAVLTLAFSCTGIAAFALIGFLQRKTYSVGGIVTRGLSLTAALLMLCMIFTPLLSAEITTTFSGKDKTVTQTAQLDSALFDGLWMSEEAYAELEESVPDLMESFSHFTRYGVKRGDAYLLNLSMASYAVLSADRATNSTYFALTSFLLAAVCVCASLVVWQSLCYFALGSDIRALTWAAKIAGLVTALALLGVLIGLVVSANNALGGIVLDGMRSKLSSIYKMKLNAGGIFCAVFALLALCTPSLAFAKKRVGEQQERICEGDGAMRSDDALAQDTEEPTKEQEQGQEESNVSAAAAQQSPQKALAEPRTEQQTPHAAPAAEQKPRRWRCKKCGNIIYTLPCPYCYGDKGDKKE